MHCGKSSPLNSVECEIAHTDVQQDTLISFEQKARTLADDYIDNVEAYLEQTTLIDPVTGEEMGPDEKLMRAIEQRASIPEHGKDSFRSEIFRKVIMAHQHGEKFDYTTHDMLKNAIQKQLLEERWETARLTLSSYSLDTQQLRKLNEVVNNLVTREGYCAECAKELLKYVNSRLVMGK